METPLTVETEDSEALEAHTRSSPRLNLGKGKNKAGHGGIPLDQASAPHAGDDDEEDMEERTIIDAKLQRTRRFLRSARALYELQYKGKRPSALLKMKPNSYGFKAGSTFDALAALVSPLRAPQVLDDWSALEISIYEDSFQRYGKNFHAIAAQLPKKSVKDTIAFYYIWKKHGRPATQRALASGDDSDGSLGEPDPELPSQTSKYIEHMRRRQECVKDFFACARDIGSTRPITSISHKAIQLSDFGLQRLSGLQPAVPATSELRLKTGLDGWTPHEIRVFELAMECYGKEFHQVARVVCGDVNCAWDSIGC
ncbi:hypothetical protein Poli38472_002326 [Pythium oligandrum]|uniref:SANT domain-containing protein n=1 Tax=Pythium oligandrum TaxID=41045 RepID=A0A8K1CHM0_PYTOL|nr:hypothetical protein Poli38472_002326 [Pythium oligandrum]|eukprot:TMW63385.1 hypothetical protein Poli38472_002326 [Pythium oligandrum]